MPRGRAGLYWRGSSWRARCYRRAKTLQQFLADLGHKTMSRTHQTIVHMSGGRVLGSAFGMPVVELHTPLDPPRSRRYLTLEFSWNVVTGHPATVIGEWHAGHHLNLGPGPDAAKSTFLTRMHGLLSR